MITSDKLKGNGVAMITPFEMDGALDFLSLEVLVDTLIREVNGLFDIYRGSHRHGLRKAGSAGWELSETDDEVRVRAELPGMKAEDIDIQILGRSLTLSGERKIAFEGEKVRYHRREREAGKFSRVIGLPGDVDSEKVDAKMVDGLLTVVLPKAESAKPRQITIH